MKKLLTIVLALSMVFALAIPALAEGEEAVAVKTVGWDEIVADATETVYNEFELTVTRLEYYPVSNITSAGWLGDYYVEYDPDNKGVVDGSPIRFFVNFTLPTTADLTAAQLNEYNQSGKVTLKVTASNFTITDVEGGTKLNKTGKKFVLQEDLFEDHVSSNTFKMTYTLDKTYTQTCQYMITGTVNSTADATATAKLSYGMTGFDDDGNFYFTVGGVEYKVNHTDNYFYVENVDDKLDYVVRFTVNSANKITNIAVNAGENHTEKYTDVKVVKSFASYADALAGDAAVKASYDADRMIENQKTFFEYYMDEVEDYGLTLKGSAAAAVQAIADNIGYTVKAGVYTFSYVDYDAIKGAIDDEVVKSYGAYGKGKIKTADVLDDMNYYGDLLAAYNWIWVVSPDTYLYNPDGTVNIVKTWAKGVDLAYTVAKSTEHDDNFYTASKIVDSSAIVFSHDATTGIEGGYVPVLLGNQVANGAKINSVVIPGNATDMVGTAWMYTEGYDYDLDKDTDKVLKSGTDYNKYLAALNEILDVLDYNWDGSTKYMQEEHFLNMFSNAYASNVSVTWKAYTATLIVEPEVDPPQTGDASTIVGFVMLAMAIAAAAVVTIKKVRA